MKKSKLLLSAPLILAPAVALAPTVASCSKGADISLSSDFAQNVDVEIVSEQLVTGQPYMVMFSIKDEQLGKQYLPNALTTVKSGDVELYQMNYTNSNGLLDYYYYSAFANNTKAYLFIANVSGNISIEAKTSQLKSITATPLDITESGYAEYEVGETPNTAGRVLATGRLENGDLIVLDEYTISLKDVTSGDYQFQTSDIFAEGTTKTGTISYQGVTSAAFEYKVIAKTVAYMSYSTSITDPVITKYSNIAGENGTDASNGAIAAYEAETISGIYTITIKPGTYDFGTKTINIHGKEGKYLTIQSLVSPELTEEGMEYSVKFDHSFAADDTFFMYFYGGGTKTGYSNTISGIQFNAPTDVSTAGLTNPTHTDIVLDGSDTVANTTISRCKFIGNDDETKLKLDAVGSASLDTVGAPKNVVINQCIGQYLNNLYSGFIAHDPSSARDLTIYRCLLEDSQKLMDVKTNSYSVVLVRDVIAYLMYTKNETAQSSLTGAMTIDDSGTFWFEKCSFYQLREISSSNAAFIEGVKVKGSASSILPHQINLYKTYFNKIDGQNNMHTVINRIGQEDYDWSIKVTYDYLNPTYGTAYGVEDQTYEQYIYWDIDAE